MKRIKNLFLLMFCFIVPCFFLVTGCSKIEAVETGFSVFYGDKKLSETGEIIHVIFDDELEIDSLFVIKASFDDGSTSELSKKDGDVVGFEIESNIPNANNIVIGSEYEISFFYKEYSKYIVKVIFDQPTLASPVLSFDDDLEMLSWETVAKATAYEYKILKNDTIEFGETQTTTQTSISLEWGATYKVRAISNTEYYQASKWVSTTAWKPERTIVEAPTISAICNGLCFEIDLTGQPLNRDLVLNNFDENIWTMTHANLKESGSVCGSYSITFILKNQNKFAWNDGTDIGSVTDTHATWIISKRSIDVPVLTNQNHTGTELNIQGTNINSDYFTVSGDVSATDVGTYNVTFTLKYPEYCTWNFPVGEYEDQAESVVRTWQIIENETGQTDSESARYENEELLANNDNYYLDIKPTKKEEY